MTIRKFTVRVLFALAAFFGLLGLAHAQTVQNWQPVCWGTNWSQYDRVRVTYRANDCGSDYQSTLYVNGNAIGTNCTSYGQQEYPGSQGISLGYSQGAGFGWNYYQGHFFYNCDVAFEDTGANIDPREGYFTFEVGNFPAVSLSVSKYASPSVLAVGASGQSYTITVNVGNGPTKQPIYISDTLPVGITVAGQITAYGGGYVYGCPGAGSSDLSGCYIPAGANGPVYITVPINISAAASSHNNYTVYNTASVSGGGPSSCSGSTCQGQTGNTVLNAIDDTAAKPTGVISSTDVSVNDAFPSGATFSATGGTCSSPSPFSPNTNTTGVLSYTVPAGSQSCTVNYQLCYAGTCSAATLTVTATSPAITVNKQLGGNRALSNDQFTVQVLQNNTPLSLPGNGSTTGINSVVDTNTGTTGRTTLTAGSTYSVNEVGVNSTNLARYNKTLSCTNGGTSYPLALGGTFTAQNGDNILCTLQNDPIPPTILLSKALGGNRVGSGDQFTVQILRNGTVVNATANSTTLGSGNAVNTGSGTTGTFTAAPGTSYTLNEAGSNGASLTKYTSSLSCQLNGGTPQSMNLGDVVTPIAGDSFVCTITNTPLAPTIALHKEMLSSRVRDSDQFTVQINAGTTVASATTGGSGSGVSAGATGAYTATAGTTYTLTEVPSGTTQPGQYTSTMLCTNSFTVQQGGTDVSGINSIGATITPRSGDVIDCVIKNKQAPTTLALTQVIAAGSSVPPAVTFDYSGNNGWGSRQMSSSSEGGAGTTGPAITLTANSVETIVTVTLQPGWELRSVSCSDANGSATSNGTASFGSQVGNTLHIPVANVVAGAALQCSVTMGAAAPTIVVNKLLGANRISNNDQFTVQLKTGTTVAFSGSNTAGQGSSVTGGTGTTGIFTATPGTVYNVGEVMAAGSASTLGQYGAAVGCSNAHLPAGSGTNLDSVQLPGDTFSLKAGDVITCNITNTLKAPKLALKKALGVGGRISAADQFRVVIFEGSGEVGSATTTGSTGAVIGGATAITANLSSLYMIGEEMASGSVSNIEQYGYPLDCQNALSTGNGGTAFAPGTLGLGQPFGPLKAGDDISCTITNTLKLPTITVDQFVVGGIAVPATYQYTGTNGWTTQPVTSAQGGAYGSPTPLQSLKAAGVSTDLTPTLPAGLRIINAYCTDSNAAINGNSGSNFGSFTDSTFTILATNIKAGSKLVCHVQIGFTPPKLTVKKTTTVGTGTFTFRGSATNANGFSTSGNYSVSTTIAGTPASGAAVTLAATNVITEVQETVPAGWVLMSASCTDKNYGVTNNADTFGTLINATTLQIPAAKVGSGVDLQCLFTNAPLPSITLDQFVSGGIDVPAKYNYTGTNGWTQKDVTSAQAGVWGQPTAVQYLNAAGAQTDITPALPSGLKITNAYCTDTNYLNNGNSGGTFGTFNDSTFTIPAGFIKGGSVLVCHVEIGFTKAKLTLQKTTTVGTGSFAFNGVAPNANGFSTSGNYSISTTTPGSPVKGGTVTLTANNAVTQIQETVPSTWTLASANCIDNNAGVTHNTDTFGTLLNSTTLQIPDTKVSPGADLLCTFVNAPKLATLALSQNISGGSGVPPAVTFDYSGTNGWGSRSVTSTSEGYGTPGPAITLSSNGVETVLTVTPLPGWQVGSVNCGDNNGGNTSNGGTNFGVKDGNSLRIPAANVVAGAVLNCSMDLTLAPPTIVVNKLLGANRISNSDQFTVQLKTGTTVAFSGSNTAGQGSSVTGGTGTTGIFTATPGTVYNVGEVMASGSASTLGQYGAAVGCSNAHLPAGTGTNLGSVQLPGDTFSLKAGDVITCNITNTALPPILTVTKTLGTGGRVNSNDQFTLQIVRQSDNAVVNSIANSTSGGSGPAVTIGTGTTGATTLVAGTSYTIKEVGSGSTILSQYSAAVGNCSNSLSGGSVIPSTPGTPFTLKAGDAITCPLTNTGIKPSFQLRQGGPGGSRLAYPFSLNYTGTNGSSVSNVTAVTPGVDGAYTPTPAQTLNAWNTETVLTPVNVPAGLKITNGYCLDTNYAASGNSGGYLGSFTATQFTLAANEVKANSTLVCTVDYGYAASTLNVTKTLGTNNRVNSGDQFTVQILTGGSPINSTTNSTTLGAGSAVTAGSGTTGVTTLTSGTSYSVNEVVSGSTNLAQYSASVSCNNTGVGGTAVPGTPGTPFTAQSGDVIDCQLTNTPKAPTLTVTKVMGTTGRVTSTDQFTLQIVRLSDGAVVNSTVNSTSFGAGTVVTAGTGTTGATTLVAGTSYSIKEVVSGTTNLSQYSATVGNCINSLSGGTSIPATPGTPFVLKAGDAITCSLTNTPQTATLTLIKKSVTRDLDTDQFRVQVLQGGTEVNPTAKSTTQGSGSTITAGTGTTGAFPVIAGNTYAITETFVGPGVNPVHYVSNVYCTSAYFPIQGITMGTALGSTFVPLVGDTISCYILNTVRTYAKITVNKALGGTGRANTGDQFTVQIVRQSDGVVVNSTSKSTTAGAGVGITPGTGTTGSYSGVPRTTYVIRELGAAGANLAQYNATMTCLNATVGGKDYSAVNAPGAITPDPGDDVTCTITNTPKTSTIQVKKALGTGGRANAGDQFTVQINNLASTSTLASSNTAGSAGTLTGGDTGAVAVTPGTGYTINEAPLNGTKLVQYTSAVRCLNNGVSVGTVSKLGDSITPAAGDAYVCTITNTPAPARLYITQATTVSITHTLPISADYTGTNGWTLQTLTNTVMGTVGSVSSPQKTLAAFNTATLITASPPLHWSTLRFSCTDQSGVSAGTFGTLVGNTLTIPAANVLPGAVLVCTARLDASAPY